MTSKLSAPEKMSFDDAEKNFKRWRQKFNMYVEATDNQDATYLKKQSIALCFLGDRGIDVADTFEKVDNIDSFLDLFANYFTPRTNLAVESFTFNGLRQSSGQPFLDFLMSLQKQAEVCEFSCECKKSYKDRQIKDRIIAGVYDNELQMRLLNETDQSLVNIIGVCKQYEALKSQASLLKNKDVCVDSLNQRVNKIKFTQNNKSENRGCGNCGYNHPNKECYAKDKRCNICNTPGHFSNRCRRNQNKKMKQSRNVNSLEHSDAIQQETNHDETQVSAICSLETGDELQLESSWYQSIGIGNILINFKLDSGSDVSVLPISIFRQLGDISECQLDITNLTLLPYGANEINKNKIVPIGKINLKCTNPLTNENVNVEFVIIKENLRPLLGLNACLKLKLIKRVDSLETVPKNKDEVLIKYKNVFQGAGLIKNYKYKIHLDKNAVPCIHNSYRVPFSLQPKLQKLLNELEDQGIVSKVTYPTSWVNRLVIVEKPDGKLRICLDPRSLNKYILREHFIIPTADEIISRLSNKKYFSVVDMRNGFWQILLNEESSDLCTFQTPFGRYKFNVLPFGIKSAPEIFQRKNMELFGNIKDVNVYFDDLIISGETENDHDIAFKKVMEKAIETGAKFNDQKIQYKVSSVNFMGLVISKEGVNPNLKHVRAMRDYIEPENKDHLLRFLGLTKFLCKFIPNLSQRTANLRNLTHDKVDWGWEPKHEAEFKGIRNVLSSQPLLKIFDPNLPALIQTDASKDGIGCVLIQNDFPVAYASRSLNKSEVKYAQIEKEMLAIVFALTRFDEFVYGRRVEVQSDHKPLIYIVEKDIDKISARLQRMLLKILKYDFVVTFVPGKLLLAADALSRAVVDKAGDDDQNISYNVHNVVASDRNLMNYLPVPENSLKIIVEHVKLDECITLVKQYICEEWPSYKKLNNVLKSFFKVRKYLQIEGDLLFMNHKLVVPESLRQKFLNLIHIPHLGIEKTKLRARQIFYWPKMANDIEKLINDCSICQKYRPSNPNEELQQHPIPRRPWERVSGDIFECDGNNYFVVVDAYSVWVEVKEITDKSIESIIEFLESLFSRYGAPDYFLSDNNPFNSWKFREFANKWNFTIVASIVRIIHNRMA